MQKKFKCLICNNEFNVDDAIISKEQIKSEHLNTKISGRIVTRTYLDTHYNIRYCQHCHIKKTLIFKVGMIIIWILLPVTHFICSFEKFIDNDDILDLLVKLLLVYPLNCLFVSIGFVFIYNTIYKVDIDKAIENNAVDNPLF